MSNTTTLESVNARAEEVHSVAFNVAVDAHMVCAQAANDRARIRAYRLVATAAQHLVEVTGDHIRLLAGPGVPRAELKLTAATLDLVESAANLLAAALKRDESADMADAARHVLSHIH